MLADVGGVRFASVLDVQSLLSLFFFIKENWIFAMTSHHANNILLARNFPFDSNVRLWSDRSIMPVHYLWAKLNNRTRGQFQCDMTLFFVFVWCRSFTCTARLLFHSLRFQVMQIKQVDCKVSTKKTFFRKTFELLDIFGQLHAQECKAMKTYLFAIKGRQKKNVFNCLKLLWGRDWF